MKTSRWLWLLFCCWCGVVAAVEPNPRANVQPLTEVTLQLRWRHQFQFAGYYAAIAKGYYRDVGLNVSLIEADGRDDPMLRVLSGEVHFGTGNSDLLRYLEQGLEPVVLGVIFQHSPLALVVTERSGIRYLQELAGRRVMMEGASAELLAYFKRERLDINAVSLEPHKFDTSALVAGKIDAMSVFISDELYELRRHGIAYRLFQPIASGIDSYGDNFFTSAALLKRDPELVRRFREASLRGWQYALAHPAEMVDLIYNQYSQRHDRDHLWFEALETIQLVQPQLVEIGYSHPGRWRHIADVYAEAGLLTTTVDLDNFVYAAEPQVRDTSWLYPLLLAGAMVLMAAAGVIGYIIWLNRSLRTSREHYRVIYESAPIAFMVTDRAYRVRDWNRAAEQIFGWSREQALGQDIHSFLVPQGEHEHVNRVMNQAERGPCRNLNWNLRKDGQLVLCSWMNDVLRDASGRPSGVVSMAVDVTGQHQLEVSLNQRAVAMEAAAEAILIADASGRIDYVNSAAAQLFDRPSQALIGELFWQLLTHDQLAISEAVANALQRREIWRGEVSLSLADHSQRHLALAVAPVVDRLGVLVNIVTVGRDITAERELRERLQRMAHTDALTGLPNRALFFERCRQSMALARRNEEQLGLFFIDLDGFKAVNDTAGHGVGDRVLAAVAERLRRLLRDSDIVARIGGDEFVVLIHDVTSPQQAEQVARKVIALFDAPFQLGDDSFVLGASIGIAFFPQDGQEVEALLSHADDAMYDVKSAGKGGVAFYRAPTPRAG